MGAAFPSEPFEPSEPSEPGPRSGPTAATTTLSGEAAVKPKNLQNPRPRGPSTLTPKGETTHYDLCVALLLQIMFAVHAGGVSNDKGEL